MNAQDVYDHDTHSQVIPVVFVGEEEEVPVRYINSLR